MPASLGVHGPGDRVGHHAGAGLHVQRVVLDDAGADGDGHVHVAGKAEVAAGAAVDAALDGFELVDDLHRADLGRAGQRAGREGGAQHVQAAHAVLQQALDVADDVHDVRIALDGEGLGDLHAAGLGDAADVVARQVDQHQVLGALLGVGQQLGLQRALSRSGVAPRGRVPAVFGGPPPSTSNQVTLAVPSRTVSTARGATPTNEYAAQVAPPTTDSRRKL
jgi:hypothetical protein